MDYYRNESFGRNINIDLGILSGLMMMIDMLPPRSGVSSRIMFWIAIYLFNVVCYFA